MKKLRGFQSKEFNTVGLKKLLATEIPTISKSTSYWRAFKVCSLLFLLPEVVMLFALLFNQVTLTEFWQISLFLLLLWPIEPIVLRMKERTLSVVIVAAVTILLIAVVICNVSKKSSQREEPTRIYSNQ